MEKEIGTCFFKCCSWIRCFKTALLIFSYLQLMAGVGGWGGGLSWSPKRSNQSLTVLGKSDRMWTPNVAVVCVREGGVQALTTRMTHSPPVKPKHPRYDCHLALVTSFYACAVMARAALMPFGLGWEPCSAVDNGYTHPSDSIRWLIKTKLVQLSNTWTPIINVFNAEAEWQRSSHRNPVVRSFQVKWMLLWHL